MSILHLLIPVQSIGIVHGTVASMIKSSCMHLSRYPLGTASVNLHPYRQHLPNTLKAGENKNKSSTTARHRASHLIAALQGGVAIVANWPTTWQPWLGPSPPLTPSSSVRRNLGRAQGYERWHEMRNSLAEFPCFARRRTDYHELPHSAQRRGLTRRNS